MDETFKQFIELVHGDRAEAERRTRSEPGLLERKGLWGETPLHYLSVEEILEDVRFLASLGANVDPVDDSLNTPLVDAASVGNIEMVRLLLELGANPSSRSQTYVSVLGAAVGTGKLELVELLLGAGADLSQLRVYQSPIPVGGSYQGAEAIGTRLAQAGLIGRIRQIRTDPDFRWWLSDGAFWPED